MLLAISDHEILLVRRHPTGTRYSHCRDKLSFVRGTSSRRQMGSGSA